MGGMVTLDFWEAPMQDVLVPLAFFAFLAAVILIPAYFRSQERARMHETLRIAYDKGQPVAPEMIELLQKGADRNGLRNSPDRDLRIAVILLGVGLGLVAMSFALGHIEGTEAQYSTLAGASIPGFIGLGFLGLWLINRKKTNG
jgi:Domain of unknown function (DUF6249)